MQIATYDAIVLSVGSLIFGLALLLKASDFLVASSSFVARRLGLSEFFIGATIVAFGTSAPELFISVNANLAGNSGVAIGNVVGSNTVNVMVILATTSLVFPLTFLQTTLLRDVSVLVLASLLLSGLVLWGGFGGWAGAAMLAALVAYVWWQFVEDRPDVEKRTVEVSRSDRLGRHFLVIVACLAVLVVGTEFLVKGAISAGAALGIPDTFVAMTVVAIGTSFPELTTSILAAIHGKGDMVIGNILGSNVFNILAIIGVTASISTVHASGTVSLTDLAAFVGSAFVLLGAIWLKGVPRWAGAILLVAYVGYVYASSQSFA